MMKVRITSRSQCGLNRQDTTHAHGRFGQLGQIRRVDPAGFTLTPLRTYDTPIGNSLAPPRAWGPSRRWSSSDALHPARRTCNHRFAEVGVHDHSPCLEDRRGRVPTGVVDREGEQVTNPADAGSLSDRLPPSSRRDQPSVPNRTPPKYPVTTPRPAKAPPSEVEHGHFGGAAGSPSSLDLPPAGIRNLHDECRAVVTRVGIGALVSLSPREPPARVHPREGADEPGPLDLGLASAR